MPGRTSLLYSLFLSAWLLSSCTYRFYQSGCQYPVPGSMVKLTNLDSVVHETSGLLFQDGNIWSFNDSGGEAALYCLDARNGSLIRKTIIRHATNVDWEDITEDEFHVYVADVGNNFATRDTIIIYRILKTSMLSGDPELIHDGIISVSFRGETDQTRSGFSSHDCEALFAYGDSLFLFSKDWVRESTSVYILPKEPGHYLLDPSARYEVRFLVTGADLFPASGQVTLVGYHNYMPVVISYGFTGNPARIACGGKARIYPLKAGRQVEGVCYDTNGDLLISAERSLQKPALFKVSRAVR